MKRLEKMDSNPCSPSIIYGDCLDVMRSMATNSVDLVFCSPPYEAARTYGIDFKLNGQAWVDWAVERYIECVRISRGLVAWVVEGQTRQFAYSATPLLLAADLHRCGIKLRKPPVFHRVGVPGSGGPDWLRNDYEFIVCASKGKLPWSDNTAMGHPPKWAPGGEMSHTLTDGTRRNQWGAIGSAKGMGAKDKNGKARPTSRPSHVVETVKSMREKATEPKAVAFVNGELPKGSKLHTKNNGEEMRTQCYTPPVRANPGNVIRLLVGGGVMGSKLCHENEAPFPEKLAEFFVKSFCPPGGTVLDCFCGSGTTLAVAMRNERKSIGIDIRESQIDLSRRRLAVSVREESL